MGKVCFVDMDGVLCDFVRGALALHRKSIPPAEVRWDFCSMIGFSGVDDPGFWAPMGHAFWSSLPRTHEGEALLAACEGAFGRENVGVLSSPCATAGCADGKREWVRRHLPAGYTRRLLLGSAKHLVAGPGKVLIDDHGPNAEAFREAGGEALLVPRAWNDRRGETDAEGRFCVEAVAREVRALAGA